ncbi:hypothetical protein LNKW23_42100 [Paralimibaculum aggregatum]|uniref:DUF1295 domain-containing protein n=1 Tax=Paralimibaculum aggregatum TaxID=3036245 RepID=A0ABQ6LSE3_9RHOB|nr:hypothetical protein [Limibaculum sp. NKW23]GMG84994.1 hypothetical protein LNKW23_42100 [Limibaculum sp. NKW23]
MTRRGRYETPAMVGLVAAAMLLAGLGAITPRALDTVFILVLALGLWRAGPGAGLPRRAALGAAAGLAAGALAAQALWPGLRYAPFLGVLLIHLAVAYAFLRGVLPGRTPILLQVVRQMGLGDRGTPAFQRFLRRQCWVWAGLAAVTALAAAIAVVAPAWREAAGAATTGLVVAQAVWFVSTHRYANRRYRRPETWRDTLTIMARPGIWARLEI